MPVNNQAMDKTTVRKQDRLNAVAAKQPRQFFRASSRLFCLNGEWYFQTRENDHGPFTRREAAERALERFIDNMQNDNTQNDNNQIDDNHTVDELLHDSQRDSARKTGDLITA